MPLAKVARRMASGLASSLCIMGVCLPLFKFVGSGNPLPCVIPVLMAGKLPRRWRRSSGSNFAARPSSSILLWKRRADNA